MSLKASIPRTVTLPLSSTLSEVGEHASGPNEPKKRG